MDPRPYYRRSKPKPQDKRWGNTFQHLPLYPTPDSSGVLPDWRPLANSLFDGRAAAAVAASVGDPSLIHVEPTKADDPSALLEATEYKHFTLRFHPKPMCLAAMAYDDYFPHNGYDLRSKVSQAILKAKPGYSGSFNPDASGPFFLEEREGNYDMAQMWLLHLAYSYYDDLPETREYLITDLLAGGEIHRPGKSPIKTSGKCPNDWSMSGVTLTVKIIETENHVLMIATVRYLTNQLLYQRTPSQEFDNRRNGDSERNHCRDQLMLLLRNQLRNDFAEYNAKPYQEETRHALLNLCSYAYDAEVRLGARMVLDYISAHIAVSSNDLRRMVPFRRRTVNENIKQIPNKPGFMNVSLLDGKGADQITAQFALLAGNTRAYQNSVRGVQENWPIPPNLAGEMTFGAVSDYRLPPPIHDLFVNDLHRRFFQRLHRHTMLEEPGQQRNADNMEIYAGSPSYLITAGGQPSTWVIPGFAGIGAQDQNLGAAVPTSFMPTGLSAGANVDSNAARELIQISFFSSKYKIDNYGVAPDFACGQGFRFPAWTDVPENQDGVFFVNKKSQVVNSAGQVVNFPGFFLAIIIRQGFVILEAFDTWLYPEVKIEQFKEHVRRDNPNLDLTNPKGSTYTTFNGNRIDFVIWNKQEVDGQHVGARINKIEYGAGSPADTLNDAGNYDPNRPPYQFLTGTILKSVDKSGDGAVMEIHNPVLGKKITLDWSDFWHPKRISESGEVEEAGNNHEVWVDFAWTGPTEGDFFHPFNTLAAAANAVADGGVIKIQPGTTSERPSIHNKRVRLVAPFGGVTVGVR